MPEAVTSNPVSSNGTAVPAIAVNGLEKRFGEVHAVRGVDLERPEYSKTEADEFEILDLRRWDNCLQATRGVGMLLIAAGLPGLIDSFARFALQGLGTPAPIAPPQNLVVTGLYRYVRNPMYVAVVAVILGQGILFGDWRLLIYGGLLWLAFHAFVLAYEEPVLAESFGAQYEDFRANVPRWLPRLTPWRAV